LIKHHPSNVNIILFFIKSKHIRGFQTEHIKDDESILKRGLKELDPHQMSNDLLGHLTAGDKVAFVAPNAKLSLPYKTALEKRGIKVRTLSQNRVEDFCFLKKTTKELVVHHESTFGFWAAVLSETVKKVSLYHVKSPLFAGEVKHYCEWKHPKLKNLFHYPAIEYNPFQDPGGK